MNILITAAGGGGTNGIIEYAKEKYHFVGTNADYFKAAAAPISTVYHTTLARQEEKYINELQKIIAAHNIDVLVPNSDIEVEIISKHAGALACSTFVPPYPVCKIANDKYLTQLHCEANEIRFAATIQGDTLKEIETKLQGFSQSKYWLRTRFGSGSKFTSPHTDKASILQQIQYLHQKYNLSYDEFLISEFLPGDDCLIFSIWNHGQLQYLSMAHRQNYFKAPGQSPPIRIKKMYRPELEALALQASQSFEMPPHGVYNYDIKYNASGLPTITEINIGRFYYNMPLFLAYAKTSPFDIYIQNALGQSNNVPVQDKAPLYFLRDQDNFPVVITEDAINSKVKAVSS